MLGRFLLYAVPTMAVTVAAGVLLGPGSARPALGARIYGSPSGLSAVRVVTLTSAYGVEKAESVRSLWVVARKDGKVLGTARGQAGEDGVFEAVFEAAPPADAELLVLSREKPLAHAVPTFSPEKRLPLADAGPIISGASRGPFTIEVRAARGVFAAPFPENVAIRVTSQAVPLAEGALELRAPGADLEGPGLDTVRNGKASLVIRPHAHNIELMVDVRAEGEAGHWEGVLPIVPGAMWVAPEAPKHVVSPAPRGSAYVSFWRGRARVGGEVVALARDEKGFFAGDLRSGPRADADAMTLAGDPLEAGSGTVTYPLGATGFGERRVELLVDGVPAAIEAERERAWHARRAGIFVVAAAAALEIVLLLVRGRQAQQNLERHLTSVLEGSTSRKEALLAARSHPVLWAVASAALVAFAFSLIAAFASFR